MNVGKMRILLKNTHKTNKIIKCSFSIVITILTSDVKKLAGHLALKKCSY